MKTYTLIQIDTLDELKEAMDACEVLGFKYNVKKETKKGKNILGHDILYDVWTMEIGEDS